jgi:hypothetical protein
VDLVAFDAQPVANITLGFELHPANSHVPQVVVQNGKNVCLIVLDCKVDQQLPNPTVNQQPDPPPAGHGESPINNVHIP